MKRNIAIFGILAVLLITAIAHTKLRTDSPKSPPTWGWTKIADVTIEKDYTISGTPFREVTNIKLTVDAREQAEKKTQIIRLYSSGTQIAAAAIITNLHNDTAVISKSYSDTRTKFVIASTVVIKIPLNTALSATVISSKNSRTYYIKHDEGIGTFTYTYAGDDTWIGYFSTTTTHSNAKITAVYRATIIQK